MEGDRIGDDVGDGVWGDGVCLGRGVGGRGRVARLEVIGGREIFGKEGKGERGFAGNSGAWILKRVQGKTKRELAWGCCARTVQTACRRTTGDNGCGALPRKRESARRASSRGAESRARHLCWDRQVGSQPMEAKIRPCEYT
jgi:hypothetical protein